MGRAASWRGRWRDSSPLRGQTYPSLTMGWLWQKHGNIQGRQVFPSLGVHCNGSGGIPWPHLASCPASHYSLGRRWVTWWANKSPLSVSWMGGAHLSRISEDSLVSLPHPLFPSQVCSFADCNELSGWFLWSPAWIWGVNKPTWAVTQKCSSHKGDNSAPSISRLCLVSETEGRGDINFAPSKPQLTKWELRWLISSFPCFWDKSTNNKNRISIFTGWFRDVPIPLQMASRSDPVAETNTPL